TARTGDSVAVWSWQTGGSDVNYDGSFAPARSPAWSARALGLAGGPGVRRLGYAKVGSRSPLIFALGSRVLSTTLASSGYLVPFCHWMPTGGVMATPGAGLVLVSVDV